MSLTESEIAAHHAVLRAQCDWDSPFYGKVRFTEREGLMALPVHQQQQVYDAMSPELKTIVDAFMLRRGRDS